MIGFATRLFINAIALWLTVLLGQKLGLPLGINDGFGHTNVNGAVATTLVMVVILGVVNAVIKPVVKLLLGPLNCLTLGLFSFVINALMFLLAAAISSHLGFGFKVGSFTAGLFASVVMGLISSVATYIVVDPDRKAKEKDAR